MLGPSVSSEKAHFDVELAVFVVGKQLKAVLDFWGGEDVVQTKLAWEDVLGEVASRSLSGWRRGHRIGQSMREQVKNVRENICRTRSQPRQQEKTAGKGARFGGKPYASFRAASLTGRAWYRRCLAKTISFGLHLQKGNKDQLCSSRPSKSQIRAYSVSSFFLLTAFALISDSAPRFMSLR